MQALDDNGTWDLVLLPRGKKAIGCRWVLVEKFNPDGSVARLKAHFAVKGYAQTYGVDYSDTFSLIAKMTYVRLLSLLLLATIGTCISLTSRMHFYMEIFKRKFIWSNFLDMFLRGR